MSSKPVLIIAEAGVNHNGDLETARRLVDAAAEAGADVVKFQTFRAESLASRAATRAAYQRDAKANDSQVEMLRALEFDPAWYGELHALCAKRGIEFLSTPFHPEAVDEIDPFVKRFKIGSGDLTDLPLLEHVASKGKPVLLSTGMSTMEEIEPAVGVLKGKVPDLALLHCTSLYPAPVETVNLRAMRTIQDRFGLPTGYSDHTIGTTIAVAAAALGACAVEKHFTLDKNAPGPDHKASLEPKELAAMVRAIRDVSQAAGDGVKRIMPGEEEIRKVARKSLVATADLKAGAVLRAQDIRVKRPGAGIAPAELPRVLGRKLASAVAQDELLTWESLA